MSCEQVPLLELVRCELDQERIQLALRHLEGCRECRERVRVMSLLELAAAEPMGRAHSGKKWYAVAAVAVLTLAGAAMVILRVSGPVPFDPATLATREPYPLVLLDTRSEAPDRRCREAYQWYREARYRLAAEAFSHCPSGAEADFFQGVSEYLAGDPGSARRRLSAVAAAPGPWREPARWYDAAACLALGDLEAAALLLEGLAASGGQYAPAAAELLAKLPTPE